MNDKMIHSTLSLIDLYQYMTAESLLGERERYFHATETNMNMFSFSSFTL